MFDYLIVGAGFAGSVLAERLARDADKSVLLCDMRPHIGGNAYDCYNPAPVINYPNDYGYTRGSEFKYLTGQEHRKTSAVYEYPRAAGDRCYPVPRLAKAKLYKFYKSLADDTAGAQ